MKKYIKTNSDSDWQSKLDEDVFERLCMCASTKKDIVPLAKAFKRYSKRVDDSWSDQDCLDFILQWVLEWNGATWDYTQREYDNWLSKLK